jgi:hypothetical protein
LFTVHCDCLSVRAKLASQWASRLATNSKFQYSIDKILVPSRDSRSFSSRSNTPRLTSIDVQLRSFCFSRHRPCPTGQSRQSWPSSIPRLNSQLAHLSPPLFHDTHILSLTEQEWLHDRNAFGQINLPPPSSQKPLIQTAAEREWLQDGAVRLSSSPSASDNARVDWRLRATSRVKLRKKVNDTVITSGDSGDSGKKRHIRRIQPPMAQVQPGEPFYEEIQAYQERYVYLFPVFSCVMTGRNSFLNLLAAEQAEDEAILKERLSSWTVDRLKEEGYCLTGLSAFWLEANQFGRPVASFLMGPGIVLPDHRFE